jgi:hypothetical protein
LSIAQTDGIDLVKLGSVGFAILTTLSAPSSALTVFAHPMWMNEKFVAVVVLQDRKLYGTTRLVTPQRLIVGL